MSSPCEDVCCRHCTGYEKPKVTKESSNIGRWNSKEIVYDWFIPWVKDELKDLPGGWMLAGGSITNLFLNLPVNDFDLCFEFEYNFKQVRNYLLDKGLEVIRDNKWAIQIGKYDLVKTIRPFSKALEDIDFTVCAAGITDTGKFLCHKDFHTHIKNKQLTYQKYKHLRSVSDSHFNNRVDKYINKGFKPDSLIKERLKSL